MIRSQNEIYERLDEALEAATEPLTCVDLMENPGVREAAIERWGKDIQYSTEKLSDTLGFMWRRELVERFNAPPNPRNKARWAYGKKKVVSDPHAVPYEPKTKNKGDLEIIEKDGEVVLNFEKFTIVIRPK
jgi:hypothetical protein